MGRNGNPNNQADIGGGVSDSVVVTGNGNTINMGGKKGSPQNKPPKNKNDILQWIVISIIGLGVIGIFFSNINLPISGTAGTATKTFTLPPSLTATNTLLPNEPTSTPVPPTNTLEPTFTFTPIPPVPLGDDWSQGCISKVWSSYPATIQTNDKGNGCWQEPIHAFSAENGRLNFLYERNNGAPEMYGLFAPLPIENGKVTITFRLRDLSNADLLLGIFSQPEVTSQGLLMIMLNGDVTPNVFIQKDPSNYTTIQGTQRIEQGNAYSITFKFDDISAQSIVNPAVFFTDLVSLPSSQKWLFLGYKGLNGYYRIEGSFLSLVVEE